MRASYPQEDGPDRQWVSVWLARLGRVTSDILESLGELGRMQGGVITGKQASEAAMTRAALIWQLRSRRWQQLHRGVFALFSGQPGREAVLWAAVLRAGPDAMLSHHTAAELARLIDRPSGALHLTLPASRRIRPVPGLVIHTSIYASQIRHPSLLPPRTRVEDTVLGLVGLSATFEDACGWVTRACGRRLTTVARESAGGAGLALTVCRAVRTWRRGRRCALGQR